MPPPYLMVTIVPEGGTPMQLADQRGAPYPTTGTGALVFQNQPVLNRALLNDVTFGGSVSFPGLLTGVGALITSDGTQAVGLPMGAPGTMLQATVDGLVWAAPGGTVTSISQGTGILATPNPIVGAGTIAVDFGVVAPINNPDF